MHAYHGGYPPKPRYTWWFAGGLCHRCYRVVQYGHGGSADDYRHGRFWFIDKSTESAPGRVRRWPPEWGFSTGETLQ
jgi:hypothetical protein